MFFRLTPFSSAAADHPLFVYESRHVARMQTYTALIRGSVQTILMVMVIVFGLWLLMFIGGNYLNNGRYDSLNLLPGDSASLALLCFSISLAAWAYLDFVSITSSLNAISGELISGRWDLLRLAGMREGFFTVSKHGVAQLKAWRAAAVIIGLRLSAAILMTVSLILGIASIPNATRTAEFWLYIIGTAAAFVFAVEPVWRMRMMTSVGLLISAHIRDATVAPFAAFGAILSVWVVQILVTAAVLVGIGGLIFPLFIFGSTLTICAAIFPVVLLLAALYGFYVTVQGWCLRRVALRLIRLEN